MEEQPKLELISFDVTKIVFHRTILKKDFNYKVNVKFGVNDLSEDDGIQRFKTFFLVSLSGENENVPNIQVEAMGVFKMYGNPSDDIIFNFKQISSPTIIYPYIRAFISNLTLQTGLDTVTVPTINFVDLAEKKKVNITD